MPIRMGVLTIVAILVEDAQGVLERVASIPGAHQPLACEFPQVQTGVRTNSCINSVKHLCWC